MKSLAGYVGRALTIASCALLIPSLAWAEGGSVRYSYEQVELGDRSEWVLIPRAEKGLAGAITKSKLIDAFDLLKRAKRSTYGDSSIQIGGNLPKAKISVAIDPKYSQYAIIIMAETIYTMTELGMEGVEFPGYAEGALGRAQVPFAVYTLTVPMWKALPPSSMTPAQVLLPTGQALDGGEFYARWAKKDEALIKELYAYLKGDELFAIGGVLTLLPELKLPYVDQVLPLLSHRHKAVRERALEALTPHRDEAAVLKALAALIEQEKEADLALKGATIVGQAKDKAFAVLLPLYTLRTGEPKAAAAAAQELIKFKEDARVPAQLAAQLTHKDPSVAQAASEALIKIEATKELSAALAEGGVEATLRAQIARALGELKDPGVKLTGFLYLANNAEERESIRAIGALAALKSAEGRKAVEGFLESPVAYRRAAAAAEIKQLRDVASLPALASAVKKAKEDAELIEDAGYAIMVALPLKDILDQTRHKDNIIQRLAYRAVGERAVQEKAGARVLDTLKAGAQSKDPLIRGASARAIGDLALKESAEILKGMVADKSADVRRDVAVALGKMPEGTLTEVLVKFLDDAEGAVQAAAMDALGARKEALAWDKIKALFKSPQEQVRAASLRALATLVSRADKVGVGDVISLLSGGVADPAMVVRVEALRQLGTFKEDVAVASIAAQLNAREEEVRVAAFAALGDTGNAGANELAVMGLADPSLKVRREAINALSKLKAKSAKKALQDRLKDEPDEEIQQLIKATVKKL